MSTRTQTRRTAAIQYEDIQPKVDSTEEAAANILHIHLPDFQKEQLKVTYVDSSRKIDVSGERPVANNKWTRFNLSFPVPQNCEVSKIQGKFQNGVLIITMPKQFVTQPAPKEETKVAKETPTPPKAASPSTAKEGNQKTATSNTPQKPMEDTAAANVSGQKQTQEKKKTGAFSPHEELKEPPSQKGQNETPSKTVPAAETMKQKDEKRVTEEKVKEAVKEKTLFEKEESSKKRKESVVSESEDVSKKRKESMVTDETNSVPKALETVKEKRDDKFADKGRKDFKITEKVKEVRDVAAAVAKKTVKGAMELSEERQTMVNMGVAVLVIVALGTYIVYRYKSSGNVQD